MPIHVRIKVVFGLIALSIAYAFLVQKDPSVAAAVSSGYVAVVLTGVAMTNFWKRP